MSFYIFSWILYVLFFIVVMGAFIGYHAYIRKYHNMFYRKHLPFSQKMFKGMWVVVFILPLLLGTYGFANSVQNEEKSENGGGIFNVLLSGDNTSEHSSENEVSKNEKGGENLRGGGY